ncbi:MAG: putative toxin-antitoxin system toxin component, PIN family [Burkholderiales bacterium]
MTRAAPRVVMDTNVALSSLVFAQGRLAPLRLAWQQSHCCPLASSVTIAELLRVLTYPKFKLTHDEQRELLADYLPYCTVVKLPADPSKAPKTPPCRDPLDVPFLQLAIAGRAEYLVTGDRDILAVTLGARCKIVTPEQFMKVLAHS